MICVLDDNCAIRLESLLNSAVSSSPTAARPFVSLQPLANLRAASRILDGFVVFGFTLRLMRLLSFSDRTGFVCHVLALSMAPLFTLLVLGGVLFIAFFSVFYLLFFSRVVAFYSPFSTFELMVKLFLSEWILLSLILNTYILYRY